MICNIRFISLYMRVGFCSGGVMSEWGFPQIKRYYGILIFLTLISAVVNHGPTCSKSQCPNSGRRVKSKKRRK